MRLLVNVFSAYDKMLVMSELALVILVAVDTLPVLLLSELGRILFNQTFGILLFAQSLLHELSSLVLIGVGIQVHHFVQ